MDVDGEGSPAAHLARRVRELRATRGLTLSALAARAGVSKGMLVQIERVTVNPSLGVLVRIADALGVTVPSLLQPGKTLRVRVFDADDQQTYWSGKRGSTAVLIGGTDRPMPMECWRWTIAPRDAYTSRAHPKGTEEIVIVLHGTLTLRLGESSLTVQAGGCAVFAADIDHSYSNEAARERVELVMIVATDAASAPPKLSKAGKPARRERKHGS